MLVAPLEQDDEGACADAPDPDDLTGHVDDLEPLEQKTPVVLQRRAVSPELLVDHMLQLVWGETVGLVQLAGRHDAGWLADDPVATVDQLAELRQGLHAVSGVSLLGDLSGSLRLRSGRLLLSLVLDAAPEARDRRHERLLGQTGVPHVHGGHLGELGHRRSVGVHGGESGIARLGLGKAVVARGIVKLADIRFTSYSNGPGSVSSKSFRSNSS